MPAVKLTDTTTPNAAVTNPDDDTWRLSIPAGPAGQYRLAQLDDYSPLSRKRFPWQAPLTLSLQARASSETIPGTWGFGLWNDPFSLSLGFGGGIRRLPNLPQIAWFFFASEHNHLSLQDDLPANGPLAMTFSSTRLPPALLALTSPALPLLALPPAARLIRRLTSSLIRQDAVALSVSATEWHTYALTWKPNGVTFQVDGEIILETTMAPKPPLGLVLWLDNQYAAFPPNGRLGYGTLSVDSPRWIEIKTLKISTN